MTIQTFDWWEMVSLRSTGNQSWLSKKATPLSWSHAKLRTNVGKRKRDFRLRLTLTAKQKKIGRNRRQPVRPQIAVQSWHWQPFLIVVGRMAMNKIKGRMAMNKIKAVMITSDFDRWGGSHAGSVNTGMEIEEKLSGGSPPHPQLRPTVSQPQVFRRAQCSRQLSDTRAILPAPNASVYPSLLL